jgi:uncharacterized phage-associated protein
MDNLREHRILNAIKYFVLNTKNVGKVKLFKLLYYLDFMYMKKHGLSITLYDYYALPYGPVPLELYNQIEKKSLPEYYNKHLTFQNISPNNESEYNKCNIVVKDKNVDLDVFTPYEVEMLKEVAFIFEEATAKDMTEASHLKNQPWDKTIVTKGVNQLIDIQLACDPDCIFDPIELTETVQLQKELSNYAYS